MHESQETIRLFLSSAARDGGTSDAPHFLLPNTQMQSDPNAKVYLTVERFHVGSSLYDTDENYVLMCDSHAVSNQYDSVTKRSRGIIGVVSASQVPGTYRSMAAQPLDRIPISNPLLNGPFKLRLGSLKTISNVLDYHKSFFNNSYDRSSSTPPTATTTLRDFYVVIRLDFCRCD